MLVSVTVNEGLVDVTSDLDFRGAKDGASVAGGYLSCVAA